jgi:hypothetical protein
VRLPSALHGGHRAAVLSLMVLACLCIAATPAGAATARHGLIVDRESLGGHCNDGRGLAAVSQALPLCGLGAALKLAPANSTIVVRRGSYPGLDVGREFDAGGLVTVRAAAGERPTIRGLRTEGMSGLRLTGFNIQQGVMIDASRRIELVDNDISPDGVTVRARSTGVLIEGNRIHDLAYHANAMNGGYGVLLAGGGGGISDVTVRNNAISGIPIDGVQVTSVTGLTVEGNDIGSVRKPAGSEVHSDAIQLLGGSRIAIRSNTIHDSGHGLMNTDNVVHGLTLKNNIFARIDRGHGTLLPLAPGARLVNNTYWHTRYGLVISQASRHVTMLNNIVDQLSAGRSRFRAEDNNVILRGTGYGHNDTRRPPRFVGPGALDFRLRRGSPAIDGAGRSAPARDRFGRARVGAADIGAVEYLGGRGFGLRLPARQGNRIRGGALLVRLRSPAPCTVRAVGSVRAGGRLVRLRSRKVRLGSDRPGRVLLRPRGAVAAIRRSLRGGRDLRVRVRVTGVDQAGDRQRVRGVLSLRG